MNFLTLLLLAVTSNLDTVHVRLTVAGASGPVEDVRFAIERECDPLPDLLMSTTNSAGVAEFDVSRCSNPWIRIYAMPRPYASEGSDHHVLSDEINRINDLGLNRILWAKLTPGESTVELTLPAPGGVTVTAHPEGQFNTQERIVWISPDGNADKAEPFRETGSLVMRGVRKGMPGRYFLCIEQYPHLDSASVSATRVIGIDLPALESSFDTATIAVPAPPEEAVLDITQSMHELLSQDEPGVATPSVTLVSQDGQTILGYTVPITNLSGPAPYVGHARLPVPSGTFYLIPGGFKNHGACRRVMDRIRAGEDLSNSGIPKFTVEAGGTATVNYSWMDAWRAIFQLP